MLEDVTSCDIQCFGILPVRRLQRENKERRDEGVLLLDQLAGCKRMLDERMQQHAEEKKQWNSKTALLSSDLSQTKVSPMCLAAGALSLCSVRTATRTSSPSCFSVKCVSLQRSTFKMYPCAPFAYF